MLDHGSVSSKIRRFQVGWALFSLTIPAAVTEIVSLVVTALLVILFLWAFGGKEFLYELIGYCPKPAKQVAQTGGTGGSQPIQPPVMVTSTAKATEKDVTVQTDSDSNDSNVRRRVATLFGGAQSREVHPA